MVGRKTSPFSEMDWMTLPWSRSSKNLRDELVDVLLQLTIVLETLDTMKLYETAEQTEKNHQQLETLTRYLHRVLESWRHKFQSQKGFEFISITFPSSERHVDLNSPDLDISALPSLGHSPVFLICMQWACCIILYTNIQLACRQLSVPLAELVPEIPPSTLDCRRYANQILHTAEFFFQQEAGVAGPQMLTFPIGTALQYLAAAGGGDEGWAKVQGPAKAPTISTAIQSFLNSLQREGISRSSTSPGSGRDNAEKWWGGTVRS